MNKKENKWTKINLEHVEELMVLAMKHPNASTILYFLASKMDKDNVCMVSQEVLTELLGKSRQTVSTAIKTLEKMDFIKISKIGTSNIYTVKKAFTVM